MGFHGSHAKFMFQEGDEVSWQMQLRQLQTPVIPARGWVLRHVAGKVHVEFWCMGWEVPLRHSFTHVILITRSFYRLLTKGRRVISLVPQTKVEILPVEMTLY